jgi:hypothetical protein
MPGRFYGPNPTGVVVCEGHVATVTLAGVGHSQRADSLKNLSALHLF